VLRRADELRRQGVTVELPGPRLGPDKAEDYRWAHAFALPSSYPPEGQPLVLLEALSAGLPIVSTYHAGIPETVRDGVDGILVQPRDIAAVGQALLRLAEDPGLRAKLGTEGRSRYEGHYMPARFRAEVVALLSRNGRP
jgi:glycosyltransferase involved in cell wall biosynthesis